MLVLGWSGCVSYSEWRPWDETAAGPVEPPRGADTHELAGWSRSFVYGAVGQSNLGASLGTLDDLDHDGIAELVIGAPGDAAERVSVVSSRWDDVGSIVEAPLLASYDGPAPGLRLGEYLDSDRGWLAIGDPEAEGAGAVYLVRPQVGDALDLASDAKVRRFLGGSPIGPSPPQSFGAEVRLADDDGESVLLAAAPGAGERATGAVWLVHRYETGPVGPVSTDSDEEFELVGADGGDLGRSLDPMTGPDGRLVVLASEWCPQDVAYLIEAPDHGDPVVDVPSEARVAIAAGVGGPGCGGGFDPGPAYVIREAGDFFGEPTFAVLAGDDDRTEWSLGALDQALDQPPTSVDDLKLHLDLPKRSAGLLDPLGAPVCADLTHRDLDGDGVEDLAVASCDRADGALGGTVYVKFGAIGAAGRVDLETEHDLAFYSSLDFVGAQLELFDTPPWSCPTALAIGGYGIDLGLPDTGGVFVAGLDGSRYQDVPCPPFP